MTGRVTASFTTVRPREAIHHRDRNDPLDSSWSGRPRLVCPSRSSGSRIRQVPEGPSRPRGERNPARHTARRRGLGLPLPNRSRSHPWPPVRHAPESPAPCDLLPLAWPILRLVQSTSLARPARDGSTPNTCERFLVSGFGTPNLHPVASTWPNARIHLPSGERTRARRSGGMRCWAGVDYSMTESARNRIDDGNVRPRALAVLRFRTSSNFVGCSTGRSAGLAPLRILSTKVAARRSKARKSAP